MIIAVRLLLLLLMVLLFAAVLVDAGKAVAGMVFAMKFSRYCFWVCVE
jgi:hypothetical protein